MKFFILFFLLKSIFSFGKVELTYSSARNLEEIRIKKWIEASEVLTVLLI